MSSFLRDKSVEAAKLFAGILVFGLLGRWNFLPKDYWAGELLKVLVDAVISGFVVFFVTEILLGRPTIHVEWRTKSRDRALSGEVPIAGKKQVINVQIKSSGETALQRMLLRLSERRKFKIEVQLLPGELVRLTRQSGTDCFRCEGEVLVFDGIRIDSTTTVGFADFTLKRRESSDYAHEVTVKVVACWEPKICGLPVKLARIESGIERIVLEGSRAGGDFN